MSLEQLEATVRHDTELLDYPRHDWVRPRPASDGRPILDVLIIGGGQGGLTAAAALMREKVRNILVVDVSPENAEGPWRTFARMKTLRTPKHVLGPDQGLPSLTIRAWYEAQHGVGAWEELGLIPKETWADYLYWYRKTLGIPVRNQARAGAMEWREAEGCFAVPLTTVAPGAPDAADAPVTGETQGPQEEILLARKVVLATGIEGSGRWAVPRPIRDSLPPHTYAHTHEEIDFDALKGKRVGILGAGACAFDNAATALENGAASVDQFFRRPEMVRVNPYRWMEFVGFLKHHADLSDSERWRFIGQITAMGQLPPAETFRRATRFENHRLHAASPWTSVQFCGDEVCVTTPHGDFRFDFVILGTGFQTDLALRDELANFFPHIALWSDRYTPPPGEESADLARHPYLGPNFETQEKTPGDAPYLASVFNFTFGALLSMGLGGASISGLKYSIPRLVAGITKQLYREDAGAHFESLRAYNLEEF